MKTWVRNKSFDAIDSQLDQLNILSLQSRIFQRVVHFFANKFYNLNSSDDLSCCLELINSSHRYNLRASITKIFKEDRTNTKYGDLTYKNFFTRLFNNFKINIFTLNFESFLNLIKEQSSYFIKSFLFFVNKFDFFIN